MQYLTQNFDWLNSKVFILSNKQWIAILIIIFASYVIERASRYYLNKMLNKLSVFFNLNLNEKQKKKITFPLGIVIIAAICAFSIKMIGLPENITDAINRIITISYTIAGVMALSNIVDIISIYFENMAKNSNNKFDDILLPLIRKSAKFFVILLGIIFIGDSLTIDMKGLITGLGIGGIAFALAAKDTISNTFGSVTVILDKPFSIGDYIKISTLNIDGMVEEVGLRSTKIRTFYNSLITLPNGQLNNLHIDNLGKRKYRRLNTTLGLQYNTPPEKIEAFCEGVRQIILTHKYTRKDNFHVYFNKFSSSSLDIILYVFFEVSDWNHELAERHRLLINILRLAQEIGVSFAFPTQTIHMFNDEKEIVEELPQDSSPYTYGLMNATKITNNPITMQNPRSGIQNGNNFQEDKCGV